MGSWPASEQDLAEPVIARLEQAGFAIYQEVLCGSSVADIVGRRATDGVVHVVELKRALTFDVIAQAIGWRPYCDMVSVAVPRTKKNGDGRRLALQVMRWQGVGMFEVRPPLDGYKIAPLARCTAALDPESRTGRRPDLVAALRPEQQGAFAKAGAAGGGHWTPFKGTCQLLAEAVKAAPGITLKDAVAQISHHYASAASARSHLGKLIEKGVVDGVKLVRDGRAAKLFPV